MSHADKKPYIYRHPAVTPELSAFFTAVAPRVSLLPAGKSSAADSRDKASAVPPISYSHHSHGDEVQHLAELRIRQWIVLQEQDARRQQHKRLFGDPKI